jgi:hypothetical protein
MRDFREESGERVLVTERGGWRATFEISEIEWRAEREVV